MTDHDRNDPDPLSEAALDALLADAAAEDWGAEAGLDDALTARIMSDAAAEMPRRTGEVSLAATVVAALGGWAAVSGLAAATVAGIWLGISPPPAVDSFLGGDSLSVSLYPSDIGFDAEG